MSDFENSKREFFSNFKREQGITDKLYVKDAEKLGAVFADLRKRPELKEFSDKQITDGILGSLSLASPTSIEGGRSIKITAPEPKDYGKIIKSVQQHPKSTSKTTTPREEAPTQMAQDDDIIFVQPEPLAQTRNSDLSLLDPSPQRIMSSNMPRRSIETAQPQRQIIEDSEPVAVKIPEMQSITLEDFLSPPQAATFTGKTEEDRRKEAAETIQRAARIHQAKSAVEATKQERNESNAAEQAELIEKSAAAKIIQRAARAHQTRKAVEAKIKETKAQKEQAKSLAEAAKETVERREDKRNAALIKALGMPPAKTTDDLEQKSPKQERTVDIYNRDLGTADPEVAKQLAAEKAQQAEWQKEGKETLKSASEEMRRQLRASVSAGTTFGFGGYTERRDKAIDALVVTYCNELQKDNKAMEALTQEEAKVMVKANVERMAPKIDKFCKDHKNDQDQEFQQSMESMVKTTAQHFAETSKAAMSSGREIPKRYGEATPADVLTKSIETRYGHDKVSTTPHVKRDTSTKQQTR